MVYIGYGNKGIELPNARDLGIVVDNAKNYANNHFYSKGYENKIWF